MKDTDATHQGSRQPRVIASVTVGRSDYGIYRPIYRQIMQTPGLELKVIVTGAHLSPRYGSTINQIINDDMPIAAKVDMFEDQAAPDTPMAITQSISKGMAKLAKVYNDLKPDVLLILGDRLEMAAAVLAAVPFGIPVAHVHGGEVSLGAMDDALRHAITKMSCVHFVSHKDHARRVTQMGEDPAAVVVCGAPGLDNLHTMKLQTREDLQQHTGLKVAGDYAVVVFHPVTRQPGMAVRQMETLLTAMKHAALPCVISYPNADAGNHSLIALIEGAVKDDPNWQCYRNMDIESYFSLLSHAKLMVGNSSSGIIEAASLKLPVVNVGDRQKGRMHGGNVIDVPCDTQAILQAVVKTLDPAFRAQVEAMNNPYGDGHAAVKIAEHLSKMELGEGLLMRPFHDLG